MTILCLCDLLNQCPDGVSLKLDLKQEIRNSLKTPGDALPNGLVGQSWAILRLVTASLAAHRSEDKFDPHQRIPPRTFLFALYILADCACINAEVFIYGVKINAGL